MSAYHITAKLTAKPGKEEALLTAILENMPRVRQEQGCLRYDLHRKRNDPASLLFYEIWADQETFKAHGTAPHMLAYKERVKDLLAQPTDIDIWEGVDIL